MLCTSCGLEIDGEVFWAVYSWDTFDYKELEAMALDESCFIAGEYIEVSEWQNDLQTNEPVLVIVGQQKRLLRAPGEGVYIWTVNPETSEGMLVPYIFPRAANGG